MGTSMTSRVHPRYECSACVPCWKVQKVKVADEGHPAESVLVVQGTEDQHRNWEGMRELLGRVYADVEVYMLDGVGHAPHFEAAEETNRAISAWVRKVVARAC